MRWCLLCLSLCLSTVCSASIIPSPNEFSEEQQIFYSQLKGAFEVDSRKALRISRELYLNRQTMTAANQAWSQFQYAYLLLENDSVSKASDVLSDTLNLNLHGLSNDVRAFQKLGLGVVSNYNGNYSVADSLLSSAVQLGQNELLLSEIHQAAGVNLWLQGKLELSFSAFIEALELSEEIGDSSEIADCNLGLGIVEFLRGNFEKAKLKFKDYERFHSKAPNKKKVANARSMLGLVAYQQRKFERSVDLALSAYQIRKEIKDIKGQGESLNNLALGYMGLKNWSQALRYLQDALKLKAEANDLSQLNVVYENIGFCHRQLGNTDEAINYFTQALDKGRQNGQMGDMITSYQYLISVYAKEKSDYKQAFGLQSEMMALKDSLSAIERSERIKELEVRYAADQKEKEIELLRQEQLMTTNRWLTLALALFFMMIVGILIYDNQRRKHRQEKQLLTAEDELQKAELQIMTGLLEQNRQKLSLYTENLLKKNELVNRLEDKLKDAVGEVSDSDERASILNNVSGIRILTDEDWEEFKDLFDGVHRGMLDRLLLRYENLTIGEQRLFLLMKLSMSTKEIANILGVSPDSVKKARYRLKKKLELQDDVSLQDFIDAF